MEGVGWLEESALALQARPTCPAGRMSPAGVAGGNHHVGRTPAQMVTACLQQQWLLLWTICTLGVFWLSHHHTPIVSCRVHTGREMC